MNFWENVKSELKKKRITQEGLCLLAGIPLGTFKNQMSRDIMPDILEAFNIACILDCSLDYLITGKEQQIHIPDDLQEMINKYATR